MASSQLAIVLSIGFFLGFFLALAYVLFLLYIRPIVMKELIKKFESLQIQKVGTAMSLYGESRGNILFFWLKIRQLKEMVDPSIPKPKREVKLSFGLVLRYASFLMRKFVKNVWRYARRIRLKWKQLIKA